MILPQNNHLEEGWWLPFLRYIFFQTNLQSHKYYGYEPARKYKKINIKYVEKKIRLFSQNKYPKWVHIFTLFYTKIDFFSMLLVFLKKKFFVYNIVKIM